MVLFFSQHGSCACIMRDHVCVDRGRASATGIGVVRIHTEAHRFGKWEC